jgi:Family of unknown function (DUF5519)
MTAVETVRDAVEKWEGVTLHDHRFGGIELRLGRRELGHLHRSFADLPFPRRIRDELVSARRGQPHHLLPESGFGQRHSTVNSAPLPLEHSLICPFDRGGSTWTSGCWFFGRRWG